MFNTAELFNSNVSQWDVSSATKLKNMFSSARAFNSDVSTWDVSSVTDFDYMFSDTTQFISDVSKWNVGSGETFRHIFLNASKFNTSGWNVCRPGSGKIVPPDFCSPTTTTAPTTALTAAPTRSPTPASRPEGCVEVMSQRRPEVLCACASDDGVWKAPDRNESNEADPCYKSPTLDRDIKTAVLQQSQQNGVDFLLIFAVVLGTLTLVVILVSKLYHRDQNANYVTVLQTSVSLFDFVSDVSLLVTLSTIASKVGTFPLN